MLTLRSLPKPSPRILIVLLFITVIATTLFLSGGHPQFLDSLHTSVPKPAAAPQPPNPASDPSAPVTENFPLAATGVLPRIHPLNRAPKDAPHTPLFIGFTRNWPMLQQAVVSYITSGWPAEMIYVVDNSGVMDSNRKGLLSLQNPFFCNYTRLEQFGVNILTTPTLFTFAQLQNYFLYTAIEKEWGHYWWSHMDTVAVPHEDRRPYKNLFQLIQEDWAEVSKGEGMFKNWALRFYYYDRLALVNVAAYKDVGGWDTHIPFYGTDCDMHSRLQMKGYTTPSDRGKVGLTYDVGGTVPDLQVFYPKNEQEELGGERWKKLTEVLGRMENMKSGNEEGRNYWQAKQKGGKGEPFYKDPQGFEKGLLMWIEHGRKVMAEKWGHRGCDLINGAHRSYDDQWQVPHDWIFGSNFWE